MIRYRVRTSTGDGPHAIDTVEVPDDRPAAGRAAGARPAAGTVGRGQALQRDQAGAAAAGRAAGSSRSHRGLLLRLCLLQSCPAADGQDQEEPAVQRAHGLSARIVQCWRIMADVPARTTPPWRWD